MSLIVVPVVLREAQELYFVVLFSKRASGMRELIVLNAVNIFASQFE